MMLEQISRLSDGDYEQSVIVQFSWIASIVRPHRRQHFVSFREQPMHFKDNQTLNLRVIDPIADEGVWAICDDGCNSCCHG